MAPQLGNPITPRNSASFHHPTSRGNCMLRAEEGMHPWRVWRDTNRERKTVKNLSPTSTTVHSLFWDWFHFLLPWFCFFSSFTGAVHSSVHHQQLWRAPAQCHYHLILSNTSIKKQQKNVQNTALYNSYIENSHSNVQIGGILEGITQANQEVLLVLRKSTQKKGLWAEKYPFSTQNKKSVLLEKHQYQFSRGK